MRGIILKNELVLINPPKTDVFVLELGADRVGEIQQFRWLKPDIAVVTAITAEHMESFKTIDAVAQEELATAEFSEKTVISDSMVASTFRKFAKTEELYNYSVEELKNLNIDYKDLQVIGEHSLEAVAAALFVGKDFGLQTNSLVSGASRIKSQPGRMRLLKGIKNSTLIDDTYNSSPEAVKAAMAYIKKASAPQKIVLLGNMNELGDSSKQEHIEIGKLCEKSLDLIVTLGPDANRYTASAAQENGCLVATTQTPYQAAKIIKREMKNGALVLLKGSQNGVFAEEAVKLLLANKKDEKYLVRQDRFWLKKKKESFKKVLRASSYK